MAHGITNSARLVDLSPEEQRKTIRQHDDVWFATGSEIAEWYRREYLGA